MGLVREKPVASPLAEAVQHVDVGIAGALDGEASAGEDHVGDESSEVVSPGGLVEDDRILGIDRVATEPLQSEYSDYTSKDWAYMRNRFGEAEAAAEFHVDADPGLSLHDEYGFWTKGERDFGIAAYHVASAIRWEWAGRQKGRG